jgi:hypothetical protein
MAVTNEEIEMADQWMSEAYPNGVPESELEEATMDLEKNLGWEKGEALAYVKKRVSNTPLPRPLKKEIPTTVEPKPSPISPPPSKEIPSTHEGKKMKTHPTQNLLRKISLRSTGI